MLKDGDLVILVNPKGKRYLRRVTVGEELHNNDGTLPWSDVLAAGYGGVVRTRQGQPYKVVRPGLHDLVKGVFNPNISEKNELLAGKVSMAVAIVVAGYLGLNPPGFAAGTVALALVLPPARCSPPS